MVDLAFATIAWLGLGLPVAAAFVRAGRIELALGVLPFAGSLALLVPTLASAWSIGTLEGSYAKALVVAIALGLISGIFLSSPAQVASRRLNLRIVIPGAAIILAVGAVNLEVGYGLSNGPPTYAWDAYQMWLLRTKVLAQATAFPIEMYSEPSLIRSQWQYPLLYPVTLAWLMKSAAMEFRTLHLAVGMLAAVFPLATFALLVRFISPWLAVALALAPLSVTPLLLAHHEALADPLLVMVSLAGCSCALIGTVRRDRSLELIAGLVFACAVSIKNDGTLWVAACGITCAMLAWRRGDRLAELAGSSARILAPGITMFLLWDLTCRHLGIPNEIPLEGGAFIERLPVVLSVIGDVVLQGTNLIAVPLCLIAIPILLPGKPLERLQLTAVLLALPGIYLAGIVAIQCSIYIPEPYDIAWLLDTSIVRLTYGVVPALFLCAVTAAVAGSPPPRYVTAEPTPEP